MKACVEAESTLLQGAHFLEAQGHIVHGDLDQEAILGVLLELETVKQRLSFLEQGKRALILLMRDEVNRRIVELMQNNGHLIFIQVKLLAVELLKGVLLLTIQVDALRIILVASLFTAYDSEVLHVAQSRLAARTLALATSLQVLVFGQCLG